MSEFPRKWRHTLKIGDVWQDDELTVVAKAEAIAARLRAKFPGNFVVDDLADELIEASQADGVRGFDEVWHAVYDWADDERVWIDTF